ncbi:MAG TPA: hypothetical protein VIE13_05835, partial [Terriglobales bacterium]
GEDVWKAYFKMETVEHFARIALVTHILGKQNLLGREEVDKLLLARQRYEGITSAAALSPSCPVTRPEPAAAAVAGQLGTHSLSQSAPAGNGKRRW